VMGHTADRRTGRDKRWFLTRKYLKEQAAFTNLPIVEKTFFCRQKDARIKICKNA